MITGVNSYNNRTYKNILKFFFPLLISYKESFFFKGITYTEIHVINWPGYYLFLIFFKLFLKNLFVTRKLRKCIICDASIPSCLLV